MSAELARARTHRTVPKWCVAWHGRGAWHLWISCSKDSPAWTATGLGLGNLIQQASCLSLAHAPREKNDLRIHKAAAVDAANCQIPGSWNSFLASSTASFSVRALGRLFDKPRCIAVTGCSMLEHIHALHRL